MNKLLEKLTGTEERVGFILQDGTIVEVQNTCHNPENGFEVSADDLIEYEDMAIASWHTHPGEHANLSVDDYTTFLNWPDMKHYVVGTDGVRCFGVRGDGCVVELSSTDG